MYTNNKSLFMGLMSGTSMDGIDAAIIDLSANRFIAGLSRPYSAATKEYLNAVLSGQLIGLQAFSQLNTLLGREFAGAALELLAKTQIAARSVRAIGSHGQTLCHDATAEIPFTIQLGCAHTIAELTGITVVADFRPRDLIVGGQGAPFAPIYHQALFKNVDFPLAVVNIGGIANVSYLDEGTVAGYDLGPGNCLMDAWINKQLGQDYDKNGAWAASGQVISPLLEKLLADPFFHRKPPKSIGKEYFSHDWLKQHLQPDYATVDVQTTLLRLTAITIAQGIQQREGRALEQVLICGGGAHNLTLLNAIDELLPELKVASTESINIDPDFIEALMFAWLAEKTLSGTSLDLRQITGSTRPTILGAIYPGVGH